MTRRQAVGLVLVGLVLGSLWGHDTLYALITLRSEKGSALTHQELDGNFSSFYRAPTSRTITSGTVTVTGSGTYVIGTEGAAALDELTQVLGTVQGDLVYLSPVSNAQVTTVKHGANLILANGLDFTLDSVNDVIILRSKGGNVMREEGRSSAP